MLLREDAVRERIMHDIHQLQQQSQDYETFREQQWNGCVQALSARKPAGPYIVPYRTLDVSVSEDSSLELSDDVTRQLSNVIIERAGDD